METEKQPTNRQEKPTVKLETTAIVFRKDLYPRIEHSQTKVQEYSENLDQLPPIEVNQNNELIDGFHRWTAHKLAEREEIEAIVTPTASESEFLVLAVQRNAGHGLQMSQSDKRQMALKWFRERDQVGRSMDCEVTKKWIAEQLSVSLSAVQHWTSAI